MGQIFPYPDSTRGPNLARLLNGFFFFRGSDPPLRAPRALWTVVLQGLFCGPIKKKNVCLILIFLATKPEGKKNTQLNPLFSQQPTDLNNQKPTKPIIFSAINRSETLFFFITIFSHIKSKNKN